MFRSRTRTARAAVAAVALVGSFGLAACGDDAPETESAPSTQASGQSEQTQAPETQSEAPETQSEAPASSAAPESSSAESSSSSEAPQSDAKLTPSGTTLKIGQEGVINDGSKSSPEPIGVTPTSLEKAPDSVFSSNPSLKKANGDVYFLKHDVRNVNSSGTVRASDINGLFFHPKINASNQGKAKRMYGSTPGCETNRDEIEPGQKASSCLIYQIGGDPVSDVVYSNATNGTITWTK